MLVGFARRWYGHWHSEALFHHMDGMEIAFSSSHCARLHVHECSMIGTELVCQSSRPCLAQWLTQALRHQGLVGNQAARMLLHAAAVFI